MSLSENLVDFYKVLANPTRLKIFDILMTGMHCNCEIAEITGLPMNLISHHLKVLSDADLVIADRDTADARWIFYSVNKEKLSEIQQKNNQFLDINRIQERKPYCGPCSSKKQAMKRMENQS